MVHLVKGGDFMIKVREFYDMRDYSKKKYVSACEQINKFVSENNAEIIDAKYWIVKYDNGDERTSILLIYKIKEEK